MTDENHTITGTLMGILPREKNCGLQIGDPAETYTTTVWFWLPDGKTEGTKGDLLWDDGTKVDLKQVRKVGVQATYTAKENSKNPGTYFRNGTGAPHREDGGAIKHDTFNPKTPTPKAPQTVAPKSQPNQPTQQPVALNTPSAPTPPKPEVGIMEVVEAVEWLRKICYDTVKAGIEEEGETWKGTDGQLAQVSLVFIEVNRRAGDFRRRGYTVDETTKEAKDE